jgi:hypothetical protein
MTLAMQIALVILVLALIGALPLWSHSAQWGYGPSVITLMLVVLLVLVVLRG